MGKRVGSVKGSVEDGPASSATLLEVLVYDGAEVEFDVGFEAVIGSNQSLCHWPYAQSVVCLISACTFLSDIVGPCGFVRQCSARTVRAHRTYLYRSIKASSWLTILNRGFLKRPIEALTARQAMELIESTNFGSPKYVRYLTRVVVAIDGKPHHDIVSCKQSSQEFQPAGARITLSDP